jgi:carboxypeptidase D
MYHQRVEQPFGVGFSQGSTPPIDEEDLAADFIGFFNNFSNLFFGKDEFDVYVTGESYAGRYVPYISAAMLNEKSSYSISGALIYDGTIGQYAVVQTEVPTLPFVEENLDHFSFLNSTQLVELQSAHKSCGYEDYISEYLVFPPSGTQPPQEQIINASCPYGLVSTYAAQSGKCVNLFNINQTCPPPTDPLMGATPYFQRSDVKAALHAPNITWMACAPFGVFGGDSGPANTGDPSPDPIQGTLPQVIQATNRVLIANGDLDFTILTNGTLLSIQNMTWNGQLGFQSKPSEPFTLGGEEVGMQHNERGLLWTETFYSGHMEPKDQPAVSYRHLQWLLGHIETL